MFPTLEDFKQLDQSTMNARKQESSFEGNYKTFLFILD